MRYIPAACAALLIASASALPNANAETCKKMKPVYRNSRFIEFDLSHEAELRRSAGAIAVTLKSSGGKYTLTTDWKNLVGNGCTQTTEIFSDWSSADNSGDESGMDVRANGDIITAYSDTKFTDDNCDAVLGTTGSLNQYPEGTRAQMETEARSKALRACKESHYASCEEISSTCRDRARFGAQTMTAWEVVMKGSAPEAGHSDDSASSRVRKSNADMGKSAAFRTLKSDIRW